MFIKTYEIAMITQELLKAIMKSWVKSNNAQLKKNKKLTFENVKLKEKILCLRKKLNSLTTNTHDTEIAKSDENSAKKKQR